MPLLTCVQQSYSEGRNLKVHFQRNNSEDCAETIQSTPMPSPIVESLVALFTSATANIEENREQIESVSFSVYTGFPRYPSSRTKKAVRDG